MFDFSLPFDFFEIVFVGQKLEFPFRYKLPSNLPVTHDHPVQVKRPSTLVQESPLWHKLPHKWLWSIRTVHFGPDSLKAMKFPCLIFSDRFFVRTEMSNWLWKSKMFYNQMYLIIIWQLLPVVVLVSGEYDRLLMIKSLILSDQTRRWMRDQILEFHLPFPRTYNWPWNCDSILLWYWPNTHHQRTKGTSKNEPKYPKIYT